MEVRHQDLAIPELQVNKSKMSNNESIVYFLSMTKDRYSFEYIYYIYQTLFNNIKYNIIVFQDNPEHQVYQVFI